MNEYKIMRNCHQRGWIECAEDFAQGVHIDQFVRLSCLEVIERHIIEKHAITDDETSVYLREQLMLWMQEPYINRVADDNDFVKNKMAQLYAMTFVIDYQSRWRTFFSDLSRCISLDNPAAVDLYLRILLAIDLEVADRNIPEENQRNTLIKDTMREQCVADLVESWYQIMVKFDQYNPEITCLVMKVLGAYISWIDITYIANDKFFNQLLKYLQVVELRESSYDCLIEVVNKEMDDLLIKMYSLNGLLGKISKVDNIDFQTKLCISKLVNHIGLALINSFFRPVRSNNEHVSLTLFALEKAIPCLIRYFKDANDTISEAVHPFVAMYANVLKSVDNMTKEQIEVVKELFQIIYIKKLWDLYEKFTNFFFEHLFRDVYVSDT